MAQGNQNQQAQPPCSGLSFNFSQFADDIEKNRLSSVLNSNALTDANLALTAANTSFIYPRAGLGTAAGSPTSLLSQLGMRFPAQLPFRFLNTTNAFRALGRLGVVTTILEGFYDIGVEGQAAISATSLGTCKQQAGAPQ